MKINDDKSVNLNLSLEIQKDDIFLEDDYSTQLESYINEAKEKEVTNIEIPSENFISTEKPEPAKLKKTVFMTAF